VRCSLRNFLSSSCLSWDRWMFQLMSIDGAPSFRSMAWSQGCSGGNLFDSSSLNTLRYHWYWGGTHSLVSHSTFPFLIFISGSFIVLAENCAIATSAALRTMGNWEWSIHPHAQSILGCAVVNQGYPRIILWLPRSVRKYCKVTFLVPVLMLMST